MRARATATAILTLVVLLTQAAAALAEEGGEGLYGKADDKVITNFGFGLMIFFVLLVSLLSLGSHLLERRKRSK